MYTERAIPGSEPSRDGKTGNRALIVGQCRAGTLLLRVVTPGPL
jgi:hypothetical protein